MIGAPRFHPRPTRAVVVYGPQGSGKTRHAEALRAQFQKAQIIDDWYVGSVLYPTMDTLPADALVLTSDTQMEALTRYRGVNRPIHISLALATIGVKSSARSPA